MDLVGVVLENRYHIRETIGVGGMGTVYLAEHVHLGELCAVKVLSPLFAWDQDWIDRFLLEARAATRIRHDNVVQVKDFGYPAPGLVYMVMEAISGESLTDLLAREGPIPWKRALRIADHVAAALEAAHACGIIHRDIKPSNCIRTSVHGDPDFIKVLDFGIAKLTSGNDDSAHAPQTAGGVWMGTAEYMAPEIFRGERPDARVDIYALGVLLYKLITGETPFQGSHAQVALELASRDAYPPSKVAPDRDIPPGVDALVLRALARDQEARTPTMTALRDELSAVFESPAGVFGNAEGGEASVADGVAPATSAAASGPESLIPSPPPSSRPVTVELSGVRRRLTGLFAIVPDDPVVSDPSASSSNSVVEQAVARRHMTGRLPTFSSLPIVAPPESAAPAASASSSRGAVVEPAGPRRHMTGRMPTFPSIPVAAPPASTVPRPAPPAPSASSSSGRSATDQTGPGRSLLGRLAAVPLTEVLPLRRLRLNSTIVLAVSAFVGMAAFTTMLWRLAAPKEPDLGVSVESDDLEVEAVPPPAAPPLPASPESPAPAPSAEPSEEVVAPAVAPPGEQPASEVSPKSTSKRTAVVGPRSKDARSTVSEVLSRLEGECRQRSGVRAGDSATFAIVISRKGTTRPNKVKSNGVVFYECLRRKLRATRFASGTKRTIVRRTFTVE